MCLWTDPIVFTNGILHGISDQMSPSETIIIGAQWIPVRRIGEERGSLIPIDQADLPFDMNRAFFLMNVPPSAVRGEHSSSCHEWIIVLVGSFTCELDNGHQRSSVVLTTSTPALWLYPGVWVRLHSFAPGTIVAVAASLPYEKTRRWPTPNTALLREARSDA